MVGVVLPHLQREELGGIGLLGAVMEALVHDTVLTPVGRGGGGGVRDGKGGKGRGGEVRGGEGSGREERGAK